MRFQQIEICLNSGPLAKRQLRLHHQRTSQSSFFKSPSFSVLKSIPIDPIEYDVTVQISALQDDVCARVRGCVRACAVDIKPGVLRSACFIGVCIWTRIRFDLQDGDFRSKKGVSQYGLLNNNKLMAGLRF